MPNTIKDEAMMVLLKWVDSRNKENLDFFNGTVIVLHQDGSHFTFQNAKAKAVKVSNTKFILVASEHCGYHVFFREDLMRWDYFTESATLSDAFN